MKSVVGVLFVAITTTASAQPKTADDHEKQLADQRAQALQQCLAKAAPPASHITETNPFLSYKGNFESLLHLASETCAPPRKWRECMDDNATGALWSIAHDAGEAQNNLSNRSIATGSNKPLSSCNYEWVGQAHAYCMNSGRDYCLQELSRDADQMQCAYEWFNAVVAYEMDSATAKAKAAQDAQCQTADTQQADADKKTVDQERSRDVEAQKQADEQKKQADAKRKADEDKQQKDREAAEAKRQAEIRRHEQLRVKYKEEVRVADAANQQNAANIAAVMGSMSGGGNKPYGPGTYRHIDFGMAFEMVPIEGVLSGADVMTKSTGTFGYGLGFKGGIEYAPLHRSSFTIGGYAELMSGGMALPGGSSYVVDGDGGLFGSVGPEAGTSLVARVGVGYRIAGQSSDSGAGIIDANTSAADLYSYEKLRAGIRWCVMEETTYAQFCASAVELRFGTDLHADLPAPVVMGIEWQNHRFLDLGAEAGFAYPRDTTAASTTTTPFNDRGFLIGFHLTYSWDHFGGAEEPPPAPETTDKPVPAEPAMPLAHDRRRFSLFAAIPVSCESLHGDTSNVDYGGCGGGVRAGADSPIGGVHFDLLAAGAGSTGIRFGPDIGTTFKRIAGPFAYAVRGTFDFGFQNYEAAGVPCGVPGTMQCNEGPIGAGHGRIFLAQIGGALLGSYTLPDQFSIEGGLGGGYAIVTEEQPSDDTVPYQVGKGSGYFMRLFLGARL